MKTLVHYDHIHKEVIVQYLQNDESPDKYLVEDKHGEPDPYWHALDDEWKVIMNIVSGATIQIDT